MNWKILKRHSLNVVPNADEQELKELKESIESNGYDPRFPIWIFQGPKDSEPMVIDGMQRLSICKELDITPLVREFTGTVIEAIIFILKSIKRRNLNAGQRAAVFNELSEQLQAELASEAKSNQGGDRRSDDYENHGDINVPMKKSADILAEEAGVSSMTWKQVKRVEKYDPELYNKVKSGEVSASAANRSVSKKQASQDDLDKRKAQQIVKNAINDAAREVYEKFTKEIFVKIQNNESTNIKLQIVKK